MEHKYLKLIVEIFEKLPQRNDFTIEQKRKKFRELLLEQFKKEKDLLISEADFLDRCKQEVQDLKIKIISIINEKKKGISTSYITKNGLGFKVQDFHLIKSEEEEIGKLFGKHTSVDITRLVRTAKKEIRINDIEFIESIFEINNFIEPQEYDPDSHDLPHVKGVDKIIYLNELGIIDFLRTKTIGISNDKLAELLSKITSESSGNLRSYLNRLPKDPKIDIKHPYHNEKKITKIKEKLKNWGFKLNS